MWIWILIIVIVISGILGYFSSDSKDKGIDALNGAIVGGVGCGSVLFFIFILGIGIIIVAQIFNFLFE